MLILYSKLVKNVALMVVLIRLMTILDSGLLFGSPCMCTVFHCTTVFQSAVLSQINVNIFMFT